MEKKRGRRERDELEKGRRVWREEITVATGRRREIPEGERGERGRVMEREEGRRENDSLLSFFLSFSFFLFSFFHILFSLKINSFLRILISKNCQEYSKKNPEKI